MMHALDAIGFPWKVRHAKGWDDNCGGGTNDMASRYRTNDLPGIVSNIAMISSALRVCVGKRNV